METDATAGRTTRQEHFATAGSPVPPALFREIVECGNQGVWVLDADGATVYANANLATLLDYPVAELASMSLLDVLDDDGRVQAVAFLERQRRTGGTRETSDTMFLRRDGIRVWTSINHGPWLGADGRYQGLVFFITDVTNRRRLHEELQQSQDNLADAQRVAHLGSWEWEIATDELRWSDELYRIFGLSPKSFVATAQSYLDIVHPDDRPGIVDAVTACLEGQVGFEQDHRVVRPTGQVAWVRAFGEVLRTADGQPRILRGTALDITAFKESEEALQRTTARYQLLQTMASAANGADGLEEAVQLAVRKMCAHLEWPAGRAYLVSGDPPQLVLPACWELNPLTHRLIEEPTPTGDARRATTEPSTATRLAVDALAAGKPRWTSQADGWGLSEPESGQQMAAGFAFPVWSKSRIVAVLEFVTDGTVRPTEAVELCEQVGTQLARVAEREQATREVTAARDTAVDAARAKSAFLATMSHEIRTPMNGVVGLTDLLLGTDLTDRQRQYAEGVQGAGEALLAIINDILDFSKIEAGKLELELIDFDATQILDEVASLVAGQAHAKGLELIVHGSFGRHAVLQGDPARLRQVLLNLISNAIKFTESGDIMLRAWVVTESESGVAVHFEVADTGMGISPEDQQRLFQAFSQVDASTTRRFGGTGLGLAISRQLVEAMGGQLTVISAVGQGSIFTFTLPLTRGDALADSAPARGEHLLDGLPVLVVDDNATNRLILSEQLKGWDMVPQLAQSGVAGLQLLRTAVQQGRPIPLALLDLNMPGMDGLELARRISQDQTLRGIRLIVLTSSEANVPDLRAAGVSAYLTKPVRSSQLYDCLVKAVVPAPEAVPAAAPAAPGAGLASRGRLLVAEDNATNQLVARAMLAQLGYRVDIAANGIEALDALGRTSYAAVLMDCQMPEMDGYTATEAIRRAEVSSGQHIPVIAITAGAFEGDQERCLAAGMDDYIAKPIRLHELEAVLHRWVTALVPVGDTPGPTLH